MSTLKVVAKPGRREDADHVVKDDVDVVGKEMLMSRCGVVMSLLVSQRGTGYGVGSATMLDPRSSEGSEGCSGWVDSEVIRVVTSSPCMLSLVIFIKSIIAAIVVIVVLLPLMHPFFGCLSQGTQRCI